VIVFDPEVVENCGSTAAVEPQNCVSTDAVEPENCGSTAAVEPDELRLVSQRTAAGEPTNCGSTAAQTESNIDLTERETRAREVFGYEGKVLRVEQSVFEEWQDIYWAIRDLKADLHTIDRKFVAQGIKPEDAVTKAEGWLNSSHQKRAEGKKRPASKRAFRKVTETPANQPPAPGFKEENYHNEEWWECTNRLMTAWQVPQAGRSEVIRGLNGYRYQYGNDHLMTFLADYESKSEAKGFQGLMRLLDGELPADDEIPF